MIRSALLRGVSACALTLAVVPFAALAQEALPTIDIGAPRAHKPAKPQKPQSANRAPAIGAPTSAAPVEDKATYHPEAATTALKMSTPIMETPVSVQVVPQQVLQDQQAITMARAVDNVSGVRSYAGTENYQVRGFFTYNTYTDGLLLNAGVGQNTSMVNVDRVEVLKGPASILYGRADPGGIVNIITKQPQATPHTAVSQLFGSWNTYRTTFDTTGPLTKDDTLLYRVTAEIDHARSFREFDFTRNYFVSPVIKWNIDAATQVTLNLRYTHQVTPIDNGTIAYTKYDPMSADSD